MSDMAGRVEQIFTNSRDACEQALDVLFKKEGASVRGAAVKLYLRNFASFNSTFGYRQGEDLLHQVVGFLVSLDGAEVFRQGGGVSFVVLLKNSGLAAAEAVARQISERFELPWQIGLVDCVCTVSVGVVSYPDYAEDPAALLRNLNLALDESAKAGPNRVITFGAALQDRIYRNVVIMRLLANAVENGSIELKYRPTWSLSEGRFTRIECQPVLSTMEFGPIKAAEYDSIAEESGVACFVNLFVIRRACELIRELLDQGLEFESLSVRISQVLFLQKNFLTDLSDLLEQHRIPRKKLALEIQTSPMTSHCAPSVLEKLAELGVETVLSGFEFGFAGFRDILELPIDAIKLNRHFIWQMEKNPRSGAIIEGLVQIASNLDIKLIAENVDSEHQNSVLGRYRCPYRQGMYFSPTLSLPELKELLDV